MDGRIKNSLRNVIWAMINKFVALVFPFIIRTIMIYKLGAEYAGLNSLFTSVLQILSLSELGIGSAIVFSMYKPIATKDYESVGALLNLYKQFYFIIGCFMLIIGLIMVPFLPHLINGSYPDDINLYILYLIYLANTVISYFLFAYKSSVLNAFQRNDIENNISTIVNTIMYLIQIVVLILFKNYYVYIIFLPISTVAINLIRSYVTDKKFPQVHCRGEVNKKTKKEIYKRVSALIGHQLSGTVNCSLDNIVVSAFLGLMTVAQYGNYYYIVSALSGVMQVVFNGLTASIGNSIITEKKEKNIRDFYDLFYMNSWVVCWICTCMMCLYQDFMVLWVGKEYLFTLDVVVLFVIYFYSWQIRRTVLTYKNAAGMWWADKFKPYVSVCSNLILNFTLVQIWGIYGVMISTITSYTIIEAPWETYVLFKQYFGEKVIGYWKSVVIYTGIGLLELLVTYYVCSKIELQGIIGFLFKAFICCIIPNIIWILCTIKTKGFNRTLLIVKKTFLRSKQIG